MPKNKLIFVSIFALFSIFSANIYPQDIEIVTYLKQIEDGHKSQVVDNLPSLKNKYPDSPSIMFLEGVLTEDGQQAFTIYSNLLKKYPQSRYADASLYRICTFYYSVGNYTESKKYLARLKKDYPQSPYINIASRYFPDKNQIIEERITETPGTDAINTLAPADSESYKYTIQAGAFTVEDNAKALKNDLDNAGYYTTLEDKAVAGTLFHIIYVGKFVNQGDAKNNLKLINNKFSINGRIVNINSK
jgi:hypothetical protein